MQTAVKFMGKGDVIDATIFIRFSTIKTKPITVLADVAMRMINHERGHILSLYGHM